ncbi:MAG: UDP-glucose 4-epimerase GalE [Desulfatibacillaceae bacterium]
MSILVTGGAGYIGSHVCVELLQGGHDVVVLDNLANSRADVIDRIGRICGRRPVLIPGDVCDRQDLQRVFHKYDISAVLHFAGRKAVGESWEMPVEYYDVNVGGAVRLVEAMKKHDVRTLVFSSSATVYGKPDSVPIPETAPVRPENPYGRTKAMVEQFLRDVAASRSDWRIALLRYFNPVGAHESGLIGEDPQGIPNNLMPYISQVAAGRLRELSVFGDDYGTTDGTGVRDYIHVRDLARGHLAALDHLADNPGVTTVNLGTGRGYSVLEMIRAFEKASECSILFRVTGRRAGDIGTCWADVTRTREILGWEAVHGVDDMCRDAWKWQQWAEANLYKEECSAADA